jgi:TRAP-type C4-dicarboxylate transport system substrate-binding protein
MTVQICMGGYGPATTTHSRALRIIGDSLTAQFGNDVDIRYLWNVMDFGYKSEDVLWMSERGILTVAYQSTSYLTARVPELEFIDLPFLFESLEQARAAMDGELGAYMTRRIEERISGYRILGYFENGYRHVSNRLRPVRTPADMKGLKIRSLPSRMHAKAYELMGAIPLAMDLKPAIEGLTSGEIDAQENPLANTVDYGVHKLHRYHTLTGHIYLSRGIYCNRAAFESWSPALQDAMTKAVRKAVLAQRELAVREEQIARKAIEEAGGEIVKLTPQERALFVGAVKPLHDEARTRFTEAFALLKNGG